MYSVIKASAPFISLASRLKKLDAEEHYFLIKKVEQYFDEQSETELGDFLNDMAYLYLTHLNEQNIDNIIIDLVIESELNYEMLACVGDTILHL